MEGKAARALAADHQKREFMGLYGGQLMGAANACLNFHPVMDTVMRDLEEKGNGFATYPPQVLYAMSNAAINWAAKGKPDPMPTFT